MALVNVVLTTYNRPIFLKEALEAILNQSFKDFKLYILDNGSDIDTKTFLSTLKDDRINIITNELNSLEFINKAFELLDSKYMIAPHDDDIMEPDFLISQINLLEIDENINLLACQISLIDENSNYLNKIRPRLFNTKTWTKGEYIRDYLFRGNIIACPTIIFRSDFLIKNQLKFDWSVGPATDLHFVLKANSFEGKIVLNKKALYRYRIHSNQASEINRISLEVEVKNEIIKLLRKIEMDKIVDSYNSASNGILLNILLERLIRKKISFFVFKENVKNLIKYHDLKINIYTVYWSLVGVFRGIKNYYS